MPESLRNATQNRGWLAVGLWPNVWPQFCHWAANNYYQQSQAEQNAPSNVKKRSKQERRDVKAATNRARAAQPPPQGTANRARAAQPPPRRKTGATPNPAPAHPAKPGSKSGKYSPRSATFPDFERSFAAFERSLTSGGTFRVRDVPRPPSSDCIGAETSGREWKASWRSQVLRWHPDKWTSLSARADDASALLTLVQAMTRSVLRAKERFAASQ